MQFSTHLGIFVRLNIRKKIPFELENTVSLAADSKLCTLCERVLLWSTAFSSNVTLCCFNLSIKHQTATKNGMISPFSFKKSLCSKSKYCNQNPGQRTPVLPLLLPVSLLSSPAHAADAASPSFHFPFACFPLCSAFLGPSVAFQIPPATFQFFISTHQFAGR